MSEVIRKPLRGGCTCGSIRYELLSDPMFVHCCHCTWCQRETGSAFALNALIEADRVALLKGRPVCVAVPSNSGKGQRIWRCPVCQVALWSHYAGAGTRVHFVRAGTLDEGHGVQPDIHIFTASRQPWVILPEGVRAVEAYYDPREVWPAASQARWRACRSPDSA